jgi:hypothetical protein
MKNENIDNILDVEKMNIFISSSDPRTLSTIWQISRENIFCWMGVSIMSEIHHIEETLPELNEFIDFTKLEARASSIPEQPDLIKYIGNVKYKDFFPELITVRDRFQDAFVSIESGVEKCEAWLYPHALHHSTNADIEALIYFYSYGEKLVTPDCISEKWREKICYEVENDSLLNKNDQEVILRAKEKNLSLAELAELYKDYIYFVNFLSARDEESDYIDATFFRAVECMQLNEYEPWLKAFSEEISTSYQNGVSSTNSQFPLFYYCRSDLLLGKASKFGLEALLYGVSTGETDSSNPWKTWWEDTEDGQRKNIVVDYIPTASIIAFAWQRINPINTNNEIIEKALLLLYQTQLPTGGWPLTSKHTNGSIMSTYLAMTALGVLKPDGYERYLEKAKSWLLSEQNEVGCWHIEGGPGVMINILCLEAIKLADGNENISYKIQSNSIDNPTIANTANDLNEQYIIFCEGNNNGSRNKDFDEKCYTKIFSQEFPNATFCSVGSCSEIETGNELLFDIINKVNPLHTIIKIIDRDDRSTDEIDELERNGIRVLSLRNLESYILDDEIIEKLCTTCGHLDRLGEVLNTKSQALQSSLQRGNAEDDLKSASGDFMNGTKKILRLTKCGSNSVTFLRDTMAPLITRETNVYSKLKYDIFKM